MRNKHNISLKELMKKISNSSNWKHLKEWMGDFILIKSFVIGVFQLITFFQNL